MTLRIILRAIGVVMATLVASSPSTIASTASDSLKFEGADVVLGIFNLNPGACRDTIVGRMTHDGQVVPVRIDWGTCDTSPSPSRSSSTRIHAPQWSKLRFSLGMQDVNADTLTDLLFFATGRPVGRSKTSDSLRAVVVFGQSGLDTVAHLWISSIGAGFQARPFFALELEPGTQLQYPRRRDIVGRTSYLLVRLTVDPGDTSSRSSRKGFDAGEVSLRIIPNPATSLASVSADDLSPERYRLRLVAVNGAVYHESLVDVGNTGHFADKLDLSDVPTGYYVVILEANGAIRCSYPVVIVH